LFRKKRKHLKPKFLEKTCQASLGGGFLEELSLSLEFLEGGKMTNF
jgi:hypothetical protein